MATTTVILGAGFGGLAAARALRARVPDEHRIVLIDRAPRFTVGAGHTWVMIGERSLDEVSRPRRQLVPAGVELVEAEIARIEPATRVVHTSKGAYAADHLVIALGADLDLEALPGLAPEHVFYSPAGAEALRASLARFDGGDVVVLVPRTPFKCPPGPYEAAILLHDHFEARGLRARVNLSVWTVEPLPMVTGGPDVGRTVVGELERRGIAFHPRRRAGRVDAASGTVLFDGGTSAHFDRLVAVAPHRVPPVVSDARLCRDDGWIPVDPAALTVLRDGVADHVYAIGDVTALPLPGRWIADVPLALPKAGVFAAAQGEVVAGRIAAALHGGPVPAFGGEGFCFIELGGERALRGDGAFFALPSPVMRFAPPDASLRIQKIEWVKQWLAPLA